MPSLCPVDGSAVIKSGVAYHCSNPQCGAVQRKFLRHFVSRKAFNVEGLGPKIIDRFLDEGLIADAADIFSLRSGDIEALERFGEKSAENLVSEIKLRKKISLPRFIYALGILHVGEETSQVLARHITAKFKNKSIGELTKILPSITVEDLRDLPDIGPVVAQSIYHWFHNQGRLKLLGRLVAVGVSLRRLQPSAGGEKLAGKTFVITGVLHALSRETAEEKIRALGGKASQSVSQKTTYLVVGDKPGSKLAQAQKLGVKIINDKELMAMLN
jgi:DNA ligase (NAD+)